MLPHPQMYAQSTDLPPGTGIAFVQSQIEWCHALECECSLTRRCTEFGFYQTCDPGTKCPFVQLPHLNTLQSYCKSWRSSDTHAIEILSDFCEGLREPHFAFALSQFVLR